MPGWSNQTPEFVAIKTRRKDYFIFTLYYDSLYLHLFAHIFFGAASFILAVYLTQKKGKMSIDGEVVEDGAELLDILLSKVATNRMARRTKSIFMNGLLTSISYVLIVFEMKTAGFFGPDSETTEAPTASETTGAPTASEIDGCPTPFEDTETSGDYNIFFAIITFSIMYPAISGLLCAFYFYCVSRNNKEINIVPTEEIENQYQRTNSYPFIDSALECGISWKYGNKCIVIINSVMFFFVGIIFTFFAATCMEFYFNKCNDLKLSKQEATTLIFLFLNALVSSYQFWGDLNEFHVLVRDIKKQKQIKPKQEITADTNLFKRLKQRTTSRFI